MIDLRELSLQELPKLVELEKSEENAATIVPNSLEQHHSELSKDQNYYLSIYSNQVFSGYMILALEGADSVEFRRIVVAAKGKGIGQAAIKKMEEYCYAKLNRKRIWLDVFESNLRGQHIYKKLGYRQFKTGQHNGKPLLYFEKIF